MEVRKAVNLACRKTCQKHSKSVSNKFKICPIVNSCIDQLPIRCIEDWEYDRIYYFLRYYDAICYSIKEKVKINVIAFTNDPGRNIIRSSGIEFDGPALSSFYRNKNKKLNHNFFVCHNAHYSEILRKRIVLSAESDVTNGIEFFYGLPDQIEMLCDNINKQDLTIIYIDSSRCEINFSTIQAIKEKLPNVDLLINIPIGNDLHPHLRNSLINPSFSNTQMRFMEFLGDRSFFTNEKVFKLAYDGLTSYLTNMFLEKYITKLREIGLTYFDQIKLRQHNLFYYASSNEARFKLWLNCLGVDPSGQYRFNFYTRYPILMQSNALGKFQNTNDSIF